MNNVMIDIETLGSASGSALLSIGAIFFDIESGVLDKHIYIEIDLNDDLVVFHRADLKWSNE